METYGDIGAVLGFAGIFISIVSFVICVLWKKTRGYAWIFGCIAGFCFFTVLRHITVMLAYEDITDPAYEAYKDWNVYRFILSDLIRLFIWLGIGILCYIGFVKQNKLIKRLFILGASVFFIFMALLVVLSAVTSM